MRLLRWFVGKVILFINAITLPKPIQRENTNQYKLDKKTKGLTIYQFDACPFCVKVRRFIRKNNLKINLRDAKNNEIFKSELVNDGGKHKVPCLKIEKTIYDKFYSGKSDFLNLVYSSADMLTVPSLIEPFGQVAVEALACGLPTLAFRNTGLEDIIDHKKTGYLSNFLDEENFLDGLNWLLFDFDHKARKKNIRDHGIINFSENKISNEYLKVYNKF